MGDVTDEAGNTHGYYEIGGAFHLIDYPGAFLTLAEGVNDQGLVVGFYVDSSNVSHGFTLASGQTTPTPFDCSGGTNTVLYGVNNKGDMVGTCSSGAFKITVAQGITAVTLTGASVVRPIGINNLGDISGYYLDANSRRHGFLISAGNPVTIDPLASVGTQADKLNDQDEIVGDYSDSQNIDHGFLAEGPELLDPVPDLMSGPAVASQTLPSVGSGGRVVKGVAADGVTEVVVRIPAQNVGDQFQLKLLNDQNMQSSPPNPDWDGALGNPGDTTFSQNQLRVSAITVTNSSGQQNAFAFAVYRAPIDFVRQNSDDSYQNGMCNGVGKTDDNLACRSVSIQIQNLQTNTTSSVPVVILRPPVVMIHGLWGNWRNWNDFKPLVSGAATVDSLFHIGRIDYDFPVAVNLTVPPFGVSQVSANSLGWNFLATFILSNVQSWIHDFRFGNNPLDIPIASVQADIVAHSMGGDIARTMALPQFLDSLTYGKGYIHKLITIDTPHLGTPLASQLLDSSNSCTQGVLAAHGDYALSVAVLSDGQVVPGAVGDLQGDGQAVDNSLSSALQAIDSQGTNPIPTALIAGIYTDFGSLDCTLCRAEFIRKRCSGDPLAQSLTSVGWPQIFQNQPNDAIVPEKSELNNLAPSPISQFVGCVHSMGTEKLSFSGPDVLNSACVSTTTTPPTSVGSQVLNLLNTPLTSSVYYNFLNP